MIPENSAQCTRAHCTRAHCTLHTAHCTLHNPTQPTTHNPQTNPTFSNENVNIHTSNRSRSRKFRDVLRNLTTSEIHNLQPRFTKDSVESSILTCLSNGKTSFRRNFRFLLDPPARLKRKGVVMGIQYFHIAGVGMKT